MLFPFVEDFQELKQSPGVGLADRGRDGSKWFPVPETAVLS
jgi:hypothetical protein